MKKRKPLGRKTIDDYHDVEDEVSEKIDDTGDEPVLEYDCARKRPPPSYEYDTRESVEEEEDVDVVDFMERRAR